MPAFAAIGATVFVGIFAAALGSMYAGSTARNWVYNAPVGGVWIEVYPNSAEGIDATQAATAAEAARDALTDAGATATGTISRQQQVYYENPDDVPAGDIAVALRNDAALIDPEDGYSWNKTLADPRNNIAAADADGVELASGIRLTPAQRAAFDDGAALVFDDGYVSGGSITVAAWTTKQWLFGGAPSNIFRDEPASADPQWERKVRAIEVTAASSPFAVVVAPGTAESLGLEVVPVRVDGAFATPVGVAERDELRASAEVASTEDYSLTLMWQEAPPGTASWLVPLIVAVGVLVLGASAVALGLARFERRPDDATLAALGGTGSVRRRIGFWQGLLIAGFGTFAGAVAGILPAIGFWIASRDTPGVGLRLDDIPWLVLAAVAVGLPLAIAVASWLVPPRRPDLTRRTAIA